MTRLAATVTVFCFLSLFSGVVILARAETQKEERPCFVEATSGAREGESLDARIERLEMQLRVSKGERYQHQHIRR